MTVKTYKAERRQHLGAGRYREHGELVPEAHTWTTAGNLLHTGELKDVEVSEDDFLAAVERFVDGHGFRELGDRILNAVGLGDVYGTPEDGGIADVPGHVRTASILPSSLPAISRVTSVKTATRYGHRHREGEAGPAGETTIVATDVPPGAPTGGAPVPHHRKGKSMVQNVPTEGAKGVYEDQSTVDPSDLNEALTSTRPSDLDVQNTQAAYEGPAATGGEDPAAGVAPNPVSEPVGADLTTGSVASTTPGAPPTEGTGTPDEGDPANTGVSASSAAPTTDGSSPTDDPADQPGSASSANATADVAGGVAPTYYKHVGDGEVDTSVWPDSGLKDADGNELYTFVDDTDPGETNGASADWVVSTPAS